MKARGGNIILLGLLAWASCALGAVYAVLEHDASTKALVWISPVTGAAYPVSGDHLPIGGHSVGVAACSPSKNLLHFSANAPGESARRMFTIDLATGALLSSPLLFSTPPPLLVTVPAFLIPGPGEVPIGLLWESDTSRYAVAVNPETGAALPLGSSLSVGGSSGGVAALDAARGVFYFCANSAGEVDRRLYSINATTGALIRNPMIRPPSGYSAVPLFLEVDAAGELLTLLRRTGSDTKTLMALNPSTGLTMARGTGFAAGGYSEGVSAYDPSTNHIYFTANAPGETARRLFTLDAATGALISNPVIFSPEGLRTAPLLLAYHPLTPTGGSPGRVPDGDGVSGMPLSVSKSASAPEAVDLAWGPACLPGAGDYSVYEGTLGVYYSHEPRVCTTAGTLAAQITPDTGNRYFLIVPLADHVEGGYGVDSGGGGRPRSPHPCREDQDVTPCP